MYLLTIKKLSTEKHVIKSVDVAREMNYSRASVHKMLRSLKSLNYIEQERYSTIKITPSGSRIASACLKKYKVIEETLQPILELPSGYNLGICNLIELM